MSRQASVGPEALICLLVGRAVGSISGNSNGIVEDAPNGGNSSFIITTFNTDNQDLPDSSALWEMQLHRATLLCFLTGSFTFLLGLARLGFMDSVVLSQPLLRGFVSAVAFVICSEQVADLLGFASSEHSMLINTSGRLPDNGTESPRHFSPFQKLLKLLLENFPHNVHIPTVLMSLLVIFILSSAGWFKSRIRMKIEDMELERYESECLNRAARKDSLLVSWYAKLRALFNPSLSNSQNSGYVPIGGMSSSQELNSGESSDQDDADNFNLNNTYNPYRYYFYKLLILIPEILLVVMSTIILSKYAGISSKFGIELLGQRTDLETPKPAPGNSSFSLLSQGFNSTFDGSGGLKTGFMPLFWPIISMESIKELLMPAILISVLGFVESTVAAKQYAQKYHYSVSPNRELIAFGAMNILGSLLNCFPVFTSLARSQVNDQTGSRTQLAGVITGLCVFATIIWFVGVFWWVPVCVLASIVCVAAGALVEFDDILFMFKIRAWMDMFLMFLTFFITIFWSVEAGVLSSIAISLVLVVKQTTRVKVGVLVKVPEATNKETGVDPDVRAISPVRDGSVIKFKYRPLEELQDIENLPPQEILVIRVQEALFFGNSGQLSDRLRRAELYNGFLHTHPSEDAWKFKGGIRSDSPQKNPDTSPAHESTTNELSRDSENPNAGLISENLAMSSWDRVGRTKIRMSSRESSRSRKRHQQLISVFLDNNTSENVDDISIDSMFLTDDEDHFFGPGGADSEIYNRYGLGEIGRELNEWELRRRKRAGRGKFPIPISSARTSRTSLLSKGNKSPSGSVKDLEAGVGDDNHQDMNHGLLDESNTETSNYLKAIIFDLENMPSIDSSALYHLTYIVESYLERGIYVCFVKMRQSVKQMFLRSGLIGEILGSEFFFRKISDAESYLRHLWSSEAEKHSNNPSEPFNVSAESSSSSAANHQRALQPGEGFSTYNVL